MKTAKEKLAFLLRDTARRAEQADVVSERSDLDCADQFINGFLHMMGADAIHGDPERLEAMRATLACMINDLRAGERLRMRRQS